MSAALIALSLALGAEPQAYPNAQLLIEPAALTRPEAAGKFIILDVRSNQAYSEGHIPGAIRADAAELGQAFAKETDANAWAKRLGGLGIEPQSTVVIYGDDWRDAARVWWILRLWGATDARLLNGGWTAWRAAGQKISTDPAKPKAVAAQASRAGEWMATKEQVLAAVRDKSAQLWDARSSAEYCGDAGAAKKKGAIPGASHLEWSDLIDAKTQKVKTAGAIAKLLADAGIDVNKPVVTYCQSGGRAAVAAFVAELMGGKQVRNYYRSWAEWGNADDTPVDKPTKK